MHLTAHSNLEVCDICDSVECNKELYLELVKTVLEAMRKSRGVVPRDTPADEILRSIIGNEKILHFFWESLSSSHSVPIMWCMQEWTKKN